MNHDVAIVGGGLVGLTAACALGRRGLRVALIEARPVPPPPVRDGHDLRTSAITPVSERILDGLGVWRRLPAERLGPFERMHVWDRPGAGELEFDAADADLPRLGHIVENRELEHALESRAADLDNVRMYRPARLEHVEARSGNALLLLDDGRLEARLVVGADGARSRVRELAGIDADVRGYEQEALVATVHTSGGHGGTAWQRFLPGGPLAFLPLPGDWSSVVWSTSPGQALELERLAEPAFAAALSDAFEYRLGEVDAVESRARFPLLRVVARRYLAPRVALLGDAAHTIHPLAGQGVNLGLLDAAMLADVVGDLHEAGRDIGLEGNLRRYERARRGHNALTGDVMSGFHALFGNRLPPVVLARNLGLGLTARLPLLRRRFIEYASGFSADLPSLAREPAERP